MTDQIVLRPGSEIEIAKLRSAATDFMAASRSEATRRAYASDLRDFDRWCSDRGLCSLPPEPQTLVLYLTDRAETHKPVSLRRRLAAIAVACKLAGVESCHRHPAVVDVMSGIARTRAAVPTQKRPILTKDVRTIIRHLPDTRAGRRDRAILLIGLAGGFRRSEIVALNVEDLEFTEDGLVIALRRSKVDQEGRGVLVGVPAGSNFETCPVRALRSWLDAAQIEAGSIFRQISRGDRVLDDRLSGGALARMIKRRCELVGLDPSAFSGHSLRAGLATQAAMSDAPIHAIMEQGRWSSVTTVTRYVRRGSLFKGNAAALLGL
jgi:integrase